MSSVTRLQVLRGTTTQRNAIVPLDGELIWDTQESAMYVGDGSTAGGVPLSNLTNEQIQDIVGAFLGDSSTIDFTYDDAGNVVSAEVVQNQLDHGSISGLGDDDHTQYLTEGRHDSLPQDNPHGVSAAQVGLGNVDNTSDLNKPVSNAQSTAISVAITAHENEVDPHSQYQTAAEAQAQVDAHANLINNPHSVTADQVGLGDVDNTPDVDKPVSTAQQAAINSAISTHESESDPHSQYQTASESQAQVDAHANLTNNPHSVTAAQTGAETTAQLNDRDVANRARANHTGVQPFTTIQELPTPSSANAGAIFFPRINAAGDGYEAWQFFKQVDERLTGLINQQANTFETFFSVTYQIPVTGTYLFTGDYQFSINITTSDFLAHYIVDGGAPILPTHQELQDSGGPGTIFPIIAGGVEGPATTSTGTDQFINTSSRVELNLTAGTHTILLEFAPQVADTEAAIYRSTFSLERIP